ncbi:ABC transporter permease [Rhizomonospora bruguierae]|uniref:ABC transporter permease n=1 Tax=Rhizomonospora bruguierae TaxID=1581705 RepID=UPI001BD01DC7|nr:ABC transporter permease [Micromonospora sp. NBRC 107566]
MAYEESTFRRRDQDGPDAAGFSRDDSGQDPGYRQPTSSFASGGYAGATTREPDTADVNAGRRSSSPALDDVFDDPAHGEPGRDRMGVHVMLEIVLLLATVAIGFLLYQWNGGAVRGDRLDALLVSAAALTLLAVGAGLTLRAGAPNLAVGPVAMAAGLFFARDGAHGVLHAGAIAVGVAAALGVLVAILVVGFHVPGWAASLAAAAAAIVWIGTFTGRQPLHGDFDPTEYAPALFGGVAALAVVGGLLGAIKPVRRAVGRFRPVGDPAARRGGLAGVVTAGTLILSMAFAAGAGVLLAANAPGDAGILPNPGIDYTVLALGAAMLGGTSAFGRRGGIFGTLLAAFAIQLFITYQAERGWRIAPLAIGAAVLAGGLIVTRLVEALGRPASPRDRDDADDWPSDTVGSGWSATRSEPWSSPLPAQPATTTRSDPWESDRWTASR